MIEFPVVMYYLILFGLPAVGFLLGAICSYLQSLRHEEDATETVLTALGVGVLAGYMCFYFALVLVYYFDGTYVSRP